MKDYVLSERAIVIQVDKVAPNPDTADATLQGRFDNLVAIFRSVATNVNSLTPRVSRIATTALRFIPLAGAIGAVQNKGNARLLPNLIQESKKAPVHVLNRTGRVAFLELRRGEILAHYSARISSAQVSACSLNASCSVSFAASFSRPNARAISALSVYLVRIIASMIAPFSTSGTSTSSYSYFTPSGSPSVVKSGTSVML